MLLLHIPLIFRPTFGDVPLELNRWTEYCSDPGPLAK